MITGRLSLAAIKPRMPASNSFGWAVTPMRTVARVFRTTSSSPIASGDRSFQPSTAARGWANGFI